MNKNLLIGAGVVGVLGLAGYLAYETIKGPTALGTVQPTLTGGSTGGSTGGTPGSTAGSGS
jgi:hypothetical protein